MYALHSISTCKAIVNEWKVPTRISKLKLRIPLTRWKCEPYPVGLTPLYGEDVGRPAVTTELDLLVTGILRQHRVHLHNEVLARHSDHGGRTHLEAVVRVKRLQLPALLEDVWQDGLLVLGVDKKG